MLTSFFRRTASATALLLAAGGMHVPLLAATTPMPVRHAASAPSSENSVPYGPRARKVSRQTGTRTTRIQTPFKRFMAPRIEAQRLKQAAEKALNPKASSASTHAATTGSAPNGLGVNFPGFFHPSLIQTEYYGDTSDSPISITADVNKDGKPDLITMLGDSTISVVLNTGTGLAATAASQNVTGHTSFSPSIDFASAVDINGDGYPDIEAIDTNSNYAYIFLNNGPSAAGTFAAATRIALPVPTNFTVDSTFSGDVIFADVTGDGKPDMVIVSGYQQDGGHTAVSVQVLAGLGDGTFPVITGAQTQTLNELLEGSYHSLQVADLNGDGKADLVFPAYVSGPLPVVRSGIHPDVPATGYLYNYVLTGNNLGTFSPFAETTFSSPGAYAVGADDYPYASYVGNFGSGSTPGVAVVGNLGVYSQGSNNDGTLQAAVTSAIFSGEANTQAFADVTGDGKVDVISYTEGYISVYPGAGDGTFSTSASAQYVAGLVNYQQPQPADFDGDGVVDLIATHRYGSAAVYHGLGNGAFKGAPIVAPPTETADQIGAILTDNLTGRGFADVLLYDYTTDSALLTAVNDGKGNFTYKTAMDSATLSGASIDFVEPVSLDINNDGKPDLLMVSGIGLFEALNNGDGTFAAPVQIPLVGGNLTCDLSYATVGDVNGDGKKDIVAAYDDCGSDSPVGGVFTLLNNGDGTFTSSFTAFNPYGSAAFQVKLGDFNKDGKLDLLISDCGEGCGLFLLPGGGDGTFDTVNFTQVYGANNIYDFLTDDFNHDGNPDLTIASDDNPGPFGITLAAGNGTFNFTNYTPVGLGFFPYSIAYADINADGLPDLLLGGYTDFDYYYEGVGYMANLGGGNFSSPVVLPSSYDDYRYDLGESTPILVGDFNSDGAIDFLGVSYFASGVFYNTGGLTMALTTSAATATQDSSVTLTSTLTPTLPSGVQATGTVTFYDNGVAIGTAAVSGNVATLTLSTLPVGNNVITAVYSGDASYNSATSSANVNMTAVTVTALTPTFTLSTVSGATLDLTVGQTGVATFMVTGNATFNGPITFACTGAPAGTSCTIAPGTLTLSGTQTATFTAVLDTTAPNNHFNASSNLPTWLKTTGGITLAGGLLLLWPSRRRRNMWTLVFVGMLALGAMASLTGCDHKYSGTPAGTYTVNVTATAGSVTQTGTIALTIHN